MLAPRKKLWSTPPEVVELGMGLLCPAAGDTIVDIGCGGGNTLVGGARLFPLASFVGYEIVPERAEEARQLVEAAGLSDRITIHTGNVLDLLIPTSVEADAATGFGGKKFFLYLTDRGVTKLRPIFERAAQTAPVEVAVVMHSIMGAEPCVVKKVDVGDFRWRVTHYRFGCGGDGEDASDGGGGGEGVDGGGEAKGAEGKAIESGVDGAAGSEDATQAAFAAMRLKAIAAAEARLDAMEEEAASSNTAAGADTDSNATDANDDGTAAAACTPVDKTTILELSFGQEEKTGGGAEGVDEETGAGFFRIEPLSFCDHAEDNMCMDAAALGALTEDFERLAPCVVCGDAEESIVCAKCLAVHCGRHVKGHGVKHAEETGHCIGVGLRDLSFWCHQCDGYLNNYTIDALKPLYNRLHMCKFKELPAGQ
jgi:precorrin-6B methylase 2